jgi:16S rRNA G527 N7-methylase RsmG
MVESNGKKAAFLRDAVRELGLANTRVAHTRFEDLAITPSLESADLVSLRAVRADATLLQGIRKLLRTGGRLLWFTATTTATDGLTEMLDHGLAVDSDMRLIPATTSYLVTLRKTS